MNEAGVLEADGGSRKDSVAEKAQIAAACLHMRLAWSQVPAETQSCERLTQLLDNSTGPRAVGVSEQTAHSLAPESCTPPFCTKAWGSCFLLLGHFTEI